MRPRADAFAYFLEGFALVTGLRFALGFDFGFALGFGVRFGLAGALGACHSCRGNSTTPITRLTTMRALHTGQRARMCPEAEVSR